MLRLRREADGDWHIQLRLDPGQEGLLNAKNISDQAGSLVLEIVCANTVTQADAVSACASYQNTVPVPQVGARILAVGAHVLDTAHGWNEIHPVWSITVLGAVQLSPSPTRTATTAPSTSQTPIFSYTPSPAATASLAAPSPSSPVPSATPSPNSPTPVPTVEPTPVPAPVSTPVPTLPPTPPPRQAQTPTPTPPPSQGTNLCGAPSNPWGYNFCAGSLIYSPPSNFCSYFACIASFWNGVGYVIQCQDFMFSKSGGRSGSCSQHGGNYRPLYAP